MSALVLQSIASLSLQGAFATVALVLLRWLLAKAETYISTLPTWIFALICFCLPMQSSIVVRFTSMQALTASIPNGAPAAIGGLSQQLSNEMIRVATLSPLAKVVALLPTLWLVGFVLKGLYCLHCNIQFAMRLRRQRVFVSETKAETNKTNGGTFRLSTQIRVYSLAGIQSPFVHGLLHPAIYLPSAQISAPDIDFMLQHEAAHIRQFHLWIKAAAEVVSLAHWFNPMVYVLKKEIDLACEISCDKAVTKQMDTAQCKEYAALLLRTSTQRGLHSISTLSKAGKQLSVRLQTIKQGAHDCKQKMRIRALLVVLLLLCVPAVSFCKGTLQHSVYGATLLQQALPAIEQYLPQSGETEGTLAAPEHIIALQWPVPAYRYCSRMQASGLSIVAEDGSMIVAAADGVVLATTDETAEIGDNYGKTIVIVHQTAPAISTSYMHCAELYVKQGDTVEANQPIGAVGSSGATSGAMCRYQVCIDGELYAPQRWYPNT